MHVSLPPGAIFVPASSTGSIILQLTKITLVTRSCKATAALAGCGSARVDCGSPISSLFHGRRAFCGETALIGRDKFLTGSLFRSSLWARFLWKLGYYEIWGFGRILITRFNIDVKSEGSFYFSGTIINLEFKFCPEFWCGGSSPKTGQHLAPDIGYICDI